MHRKVAYLTQKATIEVKDEEIRPIRDNEVLINIKAIGICGSDVSYYAKGTSGLGYLNYPHILGHECAGVIEEVGSEVTGFSKGERVAIEPGLPCGKCEYCTSGKYNLCENLSFMGTAVVRPYGEGGMTDYVIRPDRMIHKIPDAVTYEQAAMFEPLSVAIHAVKRGQITAGQKVAVLGCGPIAGCLLQVLKAAGASAIYMTGHHDARLERMMSLGATRVFNVKGLSKEENIGLLPEQVDVVFDTTCSEDAINAAFHWIKKGGILVEVGVPISNKSLDMNTAFIRELAIISTFRYENTYPKAISMTAAGLLKPEELVTHHFPIEQTWDAMKLAASRSDSVMKIVIDT